MPDTVTPYSLRHRPGTYDNPFAPDNVYGHAVELLRRHRGDGEGALHIDIGSGFGRIAEPLVAALGVTYLACDLDEDALGSLAERGFETHRLELGAEQRIYLSLVAIIGRRRLASISIIDTLEHLDDPSAAMRALSRIAAEHQAFVLVSVPNIAHRDVGMRLLFGLWDYTETGILDHTHRTLFSDSVLRRMLAASGLHIIDEHDVRLRQSDQHFPEDHPALQRGTYLHGLLCELRDLGDGFGDTNQLVRLCVSGPVARAPAFVTHALSERPLLSVVIRSEGRQADLLVALLTCLAGQSVTDFEILILGHALDRTRQVVIEQVIWESPAWLREKIRFLRVDHGNWTDLLNDGFAAATGQHICVLDERDMVFAHWAEHFLHAARMAPGRILRGDAVTQVIGRVEYNFATGIRANTGLHKPHSSKFDFFEHLRGDASASPCIAFPRGLFHHLRIRFDPELDNFAVWDVLLRGAAWAGVTSVSTVTAIRQLWHAEPGAREAVERDHLLVKFGKCAAPLWPAACIGQVRDNLGELARLRQEVADRKLELAAMTNGVDEHRQALAAIAAIYGSTSWRVTAALRRFGRNRAMNEASAGLLATAQLRNLETALYASRSWRITAWLRRKPAL